MKRLSHLLLVGIIGLATSAGCNGNDQSQKKKHCTEIRYVDADGDSFGDPITGAWLPCTDESTVDNGSDCDDANAAINPANVEVCNGVDDDCDFIIDGLDAIDSTIWYRDMDGDTFGNPNRTVVACMQPPGYVADGTDCNDTTGNANPALSESCDGIDNDCDGEVDEEGASGTRSWYVDVDGDGYGTDVLVVEGCDPPEGYAGSADDCNDLNRDTWPGAPELYDGEDNDCDGIVDELSGSLFFDGSDDAVWINDDAAFTIHSAISFEAWVYSGNTKAEAPVLVKAKCDNSDDDQYWFGLMNGKFGMMLGTGIGWGLSARDSGSIQRNVWTFIASVWDGNNWYNYQDGELVGSSPYAGYMPAGTQDLSIGINSGCETARFSGNLADVRLWSEARSAEQILDDMAGSAVGPGLVGWWRLSEGEGQVAVDASGNGHDGRLGSSVSADEGDPTWTSEAP
jgi:hypothetical protein